MSMRKPLLVVPINDTLTTHFGAVSGLKVVPVARSRQVYIEWMEATDLTILLPKE
jgi:hypothetical protein